MADPPPAPSLQDSPAPANAKAPRVYLYHTRLGLGLMVLSIALMHIAVWTGEALERPVAWWSMASFGGLALAYLAIRSGWSRRFADPSLTLAQMIFAITSAAIAYALLGPSRGAVFPVLAVVLMFGMFRNSPRGAYGVSIYALMLFGGVMGLMAWLRPAVFMPTVELGQFVTLAVMLPAVAVISARASAVRARLKQQKLELADALTRINTMATRDDLTGLFNRRRMQELLEIEVARAGRARHRFCLALLDLDHFKRVNDEHGHGAGDAVLRCFAQAGSQAIREGDILARWGGEEFVLLFTDTRLATATVGAERLRAHVAALHIPLDGAQHLRISVSIGLVEYRKGEGLQSLLDRADQLLYEAKEQGRNRVVAVPNTTASLSI